VSASCWSNPTDPHPTATRSTADAQRVGECGTQLLCTVVGVERHIGDALGDRGGGRRQRRERELVRRQLDGVVEVPWSAIAAAAERPGR
jgi:hypothetical protein